MTIQQLEKEYKGQIRVVYKNFIVHPSMATEPALSACAANLQGKFIPIKKRIWKEAWGRGQLGAVKDFSRKNLERIAQKEKLQMAKFRMDRDTVCPGVLAVEQAQMRAVGTTGTPAFYINGRFLSGAQPIQNFRNLINEELKKANQRIAAKEATVKNYYQIFVQNKDQRF